MPVRKRPYFLGVYLSAEAGALLEERSGKRGRSALVRRMLAYAIRHMPKGWRP